MIRHATVADHYIWAALWGEFLKQQYKEHDGEIIPTQRTMVYYDRLFSRFVHDPSTGIVLIGPDNEGVLMWGDIGQPPDDTKWGRIASGLGMYVRPHRQRQGWGEKLRREAGRHLKAQGFETQIGSVLAGNKAGRGSALRVGAIFYQSMFAWDLEEV